MSLSRPWLIAACLCLSLADAAGAQAAKSVFLEDLTWTELRDDLRAGQTTDHRAGRRHRAERAAHGARQAQRPRQGARRTNRREPGQRAGRAGDRLRPRGRRSTPPTGAHALRRHDHASPKQRSRRRSSTRRAAFSRHGFRDIVLIGDHGGYQKSLRQGRRPGSNREWAAIAGARARRRRVLPGATERRLRRRR